MQMAYAAGRGYMLQRIPYNFAWEAMWSFLNNPEGIRIYYRIPNTTALFMAAMLLTPCFGEAMIQILNTIIKTPIEPCEVFILQYLRLFDDRFFSLIFNLLRFFLYQRICFNEMWVPYVKNLFKKLSNDT